MKIIKTFFYSICAIILTLMCLGSIFGTVTILSTATFISGKTITIVLLILLISISGFLSIVCWKKMLHLNNKTKKQSQITAQLALTEHNAYSSIAESNHITSRKTLPENILNEPQNIQHTETEFSNPKFHRTDREEELSFNFVKRYGREISILTEKFESLYRNACQTDDLDGQIDLLYKAAEAFEKAKEFCYSKGNGGTIYFQDMWEYLHNTRQPCFSFLDIIINALEDAKYEKNLAIADKLQNLHNIEAQNIFNHTEEIPYLINQRRTIPNWQIQSLTRVIQESYQIICETDNPETLCNRYKFALSKVEELTYYYHQNQYTDSAAINKYTEMFSDESFAMLIVQCYHKYVDKANRELKTQNGIDKRIDKFWTTIQDNVNMNLYLQLRNQLK